MAEGLITYRGAVYPRHCDHMGHMNVASYVAKFDEATWQLFSAIGLTQSYLREANRGMAGVEQHIRYARELFPGAVVTVRSSVLEVREKTLHFAHEMSNDDTGEIAARTTLVAVHLDTVARKSCPFAPEIVAAARRMIDSSRSPDS